MQKTKIEWCDSTWNPVTGCLNGCPYCYAKSIAHRFGGHWDGEQNTQDDPMMKYAKGVVLEEPMERMDNNDQLVKAPFPFGFFPTFHRYRLDEPQQHKKPQRIFVCSMADLFGPWVPDEWIVSVFDACKKAPQHKYMFLTKFPERYVELAEKGLLPSLGNFWYGQSKSSGVVEAFLRPEGSGFPAYHQFLSAEPLFGSVTAVWFELVIIGAETGNRKEKVIPSQTAVFMTTEAKDYFRTKIFMKDSLIPIIGEKWMLRQMPKELEV